MNVNRLTQSPTEADLEAKIRSTIKRVFFNLPDHSIQHQIKFKFNFGHKTIEVDGSQPSSAQSIADVVLFWGDIPLAVLELKRPGVELREEDGLQGISYASAMHPSAPLVVVTNGKESLFYETQTGMPWEPREIDEHSLKGLMESAARAARSDMKFAINTLMGTNPDIWMQAIRHTTEQTLNELMGELDELTLPFARNFLIKREATKSIIEKLDNGERLVFLEGSSLSGKSSVLRELCVETSTCVQRATLFIRNDGHSSILQTIVDALEDTLRWPLTLEEARSWLKRLSTSDGPDLVLAIDGLNSDAKEIQKEIKDLSSKAFGSCLKMVVALDTSIAARLSIDKGRNETTIGKRACLVKVEPLSDHEFELAEQSLKTLRLQFVQGAKFSNDYRQPWIIRSVSAFAISESSSLDLESEAHIAPLPTASLIKFARQRFVDGELCELFQMLASATLKEAQDHGRHRVLKDEFNLTPVIRKKTLLQHMCSAELECLIEFGYLVKLTHHVTGECVCYVRQPALLASEVSGLIRKEVLSYRSTQTIDAAQWLARVTEHLPLGGIIVAQALWDARFENIGFIKGIINRFLTVKPFVCQPNIGKEFTVFHENGLPIRLRMIKKDVFEVLEDGKPPKIVSGKYKIEYMVGDFAPWEILSHLAEFEACNGQEESLFSVEEVFLKIGKASTPFLMGSKDSKAIEMHDISDDERVVGYSSGIVEQITQSLWMFLKSDLARSRSFLEAVMSEDSVPLLCRVHIALVELVKLNDQELSAWSQDMLDNCLIPALHLKAPKIFSVKG